MTTRTFILIVFVLAPTFLSLSACGVERRHDRREDRREDRRDDRQDERRDERRDGMLMFTPQPPLTTARDRVVITSLTPPAGTAVAA